MSHIDAHAQFQGMPGFILKWLAVFFYENVAAHVY